MYSNTLCTAAELNVGLDPYHLFMFNEKGSLYVQAKVIDVLRYLIYRDNL